MHDYELGQALRALEVPKHRPDFLPELQRRLERRRRRFWWPRPRLLPAAAGVAAAAVGLVVLNEALRSTDFATAAEVRATAAEVRAAVMHALSSVRSLRGTVVVRESGDATRWAFLLTERGASG